MRIRKSWVAVGAAAALGVGATTTAASALNDRGELSTTAGVIDLPGGTSPDRVSDDDPGYVAPGPDPAVAGSADATASSDSPAPAPAGPAQVAPAPQQAPAPAPAYAADSADAPDVVSAQSADSP